MMTPLHSASERGHEKIVSFLLEKGANPNLRTILGNTALHFAAEKGHLCVLETLLAQPALDRQGLTSHGLSALPSRCLKGNRSSVEKILASGLEVDSPEKNSQATSLHMASERGHAEIVGILLSKNAATNRLTKDGHSALYYASQNGHETVSCLLLAAGLDPDVGSLNLKVTSERIAKTKRMRWILNHPELWELFYGVWFQELFSVAQ